MAAAEANDSPTDEYEPYSRGESMVVVLAVGGGETMDEWKSCGRGDFVLEGDEAAKGEMELCLRWDDDWGGGGWAAVM